MDVRRYVRRVACAHLGVEIPKITVVLWPLFLGWRLFLRQHLPAFCLADCAAHFVPEKQSMRIVNVTRSERGKNVFTTAIIDSRRRIPGCIPGQLCHPPLCLLELIDSQQLVHLSAGALLLLQRGMGGGKFSYRRDHALGLTHDLAAKPGGEYLPGLMRRACREDGTNVPVVHRLR